MTSATLKHRNIGGQLLQAALGNSVSIFYLSPLADYSGAAPVRGGVPVLFPQFADSGSLPKHGFARTAPWQLLNESVSNRSYSLSYFLDIQQDDYPEWPHAARLNLTIESNSPDLFLCLKIINTGNSTFGWTGGLHPYFYVENLLESSVTGLMGLSCHDRYNSAFKVQLDENLHWDNQPFERFYDKCPPLVLKSANHSLKLSASGFDQWMIWNPGEAGGNLISDLPTDDWRKFVCIEPVCVSRPVTLLPGQEFTGNLRITIDKIYP